MNRRSALPLAALPLVGALAWPRAAHAATGGGLEIFPDPGVLLVLIALFLLLVYPLDRLLFKPLLAVLDERRERIQGARTRADALAGDADEVMRRYQGQVSEARTEAEVQRREVLDRGRAEQTQVMNEARRDAERRTAEARREVAEALESARTQLRRDAEGLAQHAASRLLGRTLS